VLSFVVVALGVGAWDCVDSFVVFAVGVAVGAGVRVPDCFVVLAVGASGAVTPDEGGGVGSAEAALGKSASVVPTAAAASIRRIA
jgi:hypothetical protein